MKSFLVFALALNLICLYYFITSKKGYVKSIITTVLTAVLLFMPLRSSYAFWTDVVLEDESPYNYLQVAERGNSVILSTNVAFGVQSIYTRDQILSGYYYDYALMSPLFLRDGSTEKSFDVLVLGMGTGTFAKECKYFYPNSNIIGVEIDEKIVDLSKKYFELTDEEATVYINDGRTFMSGPEAGMYDIILVDAYHDITIPFHMATTEFFAELKEHLRPGGVLMVNINMRSENSTEITDYLTHTLKNNMKKVYKYDIPGITNTLVYSSDDENCLQYLKDNSSALGQDSLLLPLSERVIRDCVEVTESRYVLTDDLAPVEVLGQKLLNDVVTETLDYFKNELDKSGGSIMDVFNMLS